MKPWETLATATTPDGSRFELQRHDGNYVIQVDGWDLMTSYCYGSPNKAGTAAAHGEPLGEEEARLAKERLEWPHEAPFTVPAEALAHVRGALERGARQHAEWTARVEAYRERWPDEARQLDEALTGDLPDGWDQGLADLFGSNERAMATREASGRVMNAVAGRVHAFTGGSADLGPSTKTLLKDHGHYGFDEYCDHNMHFGVREHAMGAIAGGMALHGGVIPYTATFLIFSDYMRPPMRLAALMEQRVVYIFTHDSIGLARTGPPVLWDAGAAPDLVLLATGSEVHIALEAAAPRGSCPCRRGSSSTRSRPSTGTRSSPRPYGPVSRSRLGRRWAGNGTSVWTAWPSGSPASERRPRPESSTSASASPPNAWSTRRSRWSSRAAEFLDGLRLTRSSVCRCPIS